MLEKFDILKEFPISTPMDPKLKLELNKGQATDEEIKWYQRAIGCLLYITLATRPDICYCVVKLARYTSNPSSIHNSASIRIFRYLLGSIDKGTQFSNKEKNSTYLSGYCDADYAGDLTTAKSTSAYIFFLASGPISYKSKLQSIIAQSTTESEYVAISAAAKEAIYIISLIKELGFYNQNKFPLYTDNNGALLLANNPIFHERTKHIAVKYHYIRDLVYKGIIDLIHIPTKDQKADGLTKSLERVKFNIFLTQINMV